MKLLQEFSQSDLKTSDGSNAGAADTTAKPVGVGFSLMRNMINADGQVSGSDINDYLERAQELNDEVESVGFAIETDDGDIVKIYVNVQDADKFEEELSNLLGLDGDFEEAVNQLAQKYDIVDVVWPREETETEEDPDADLSIEDETAEIELDNPEASSETPAESSTDEIIDIPPADEEPAASASASTEETPEDEIIDIPPAGEEAATAETSVSGEDEIIDIPPAGEAAEEDEQEPVLNPDGTQKLDKDGNPVMRKKKVSESARAEIEAHIAAYQDSMAGKYRIRKTISGDIYGPRSSFVKHDGDVAYFEDLKSATDEATRLAKQMNRAGATVSYRYEPQLVQESHMTIGSNFLARLDERAKPVDSDQVKDGMNIPLEPGHMQLVSILKRPLEKKIVALFAMSGIVGRLLKAEPDAIERIRERGDMLRKNKAAQIAFNAFYDAFATASGYAPTKMAEAAIVEKHDAKRGSATQKRLEAVLVALGLPEGLITVKGPGILAPFIAKATLTIDQSGDLKSLLAKLAMRLGVHGSEAPEDLADTEADVKKTKKKDDENEEETLGESFLRRIDELNPVKSNDPFASDVIELLRALGVPEEHLSYKQQLLKSSLEKTGRSLKQRSLVDQRVEALTRMLASGKKPQAQAAQAAQVNAMEEGQLMEAFGELEALTKADFEHLNLQEPSAGPAFLASYIGSDNHEETVLVVGVDPDASGHKTLRVGIDGPWDGIIHNRYFTDDEEGYKTALKYANMLRTANLKSGGRPKGWK